MRWPSSQIGKVAACIGLTLSGGSVGFAVIRGVHGANTPIALAVVAAAMVVANAIPKALDSISKCIAAKGEADKKRIEAKKDAVVALSTAKCDAEVRKERADTRNQLLLEAAKEHPLEAVKL